MKAPKNDFLSVQTNTFFVKGRIRTSVWFGGLKIPVCVCYTSCSSSCAGFSPQKYMKFGCCCVCCALRQASVGLVCRMSHSLSFSTSCGYKSLWNNYMRPYLVGTFSAWYINYWTSHIKTWYSSRTIVKNLVQSTWVLSGCTNTNHIFKPRALTKIS